MSINFILIFFVLIVVAMIAFILVQKGAGATAGSAFGSGASSTVFGAKGSGNFLTKTTMVLAILFFSISMFMAVDARKKFSATSTGEVDLGVVGILDANETDIPEISPTDPTSVEGEDVPTLDGATDVLDKTEAVINEADDASDMIDDVINSATDVKQDVQDKAAELKEDVKEKIEKSEIMEKAQDVKETVDS